MWPCGVIDARKDRFSAEGRKPLIEHIPDHIAHCRHVGQAPRHVDQKQTHLDRLIKLVEASRLNDLTADGLERYMRTLLDDGLSARTANFARQIAVAFASWCVKTGRMESNPLNVVPKLDDQRDRRRVRRSLGDDELARLLDMAGGRGRKAWYLSAVLVGLRKGDLHVTRTTLGTNLARAGVAPQIAQRIMRHSDYKTTIKHYTVLGLTDTTKAIGELTSIGRPAGESVKATGTNDPTPIGSAKRCGQVRIGATDRETTTNGVTAVSQGQRIWNFWVVQPQTGE